MISYAGVSIFIFGNKLEKNKTELANGVREEFNISLEQGLIVLPIGATGFIAKELWEEVLKDAKNYFDSKELIKLFEQLGDETKTPKELIKIIIQLLSLLTNK